MICSRGIDRRGASMLGYLDFLYLGYSGRIGRTTYWLAYLVLAALQVGVIVGLTALAHDSFEELAAYANGRNHVELPPELMQGFLMHVVVPFVIVTVLFLWPQYALATKRWHDRGKSGWWSLIVFVPIIGGLWALIELGFLGGQPGVNEYGYR
jgi:uncharacterized membrane protein YhaH (DUF805 family)